MIYSSSIMAFLYRIIEYSMSDYKDTLNLPATDFPMKANLANREGSFLKTWQEQDLVTYVCQIAYAQINLNFSNLNKFKHCLMQLN